MPLAVAIADYYYSAFKNRLSVNKNGRIVFDEQSHNAIKLKAALEKAVRGNKQLSPEFYSKFGSHLNDMDGGSFAEELVLALAKLIKISRAEELTVTPTDFSKFRWSKENPVTLDRLIYCRDIQDPESSLLWSTELDAPLPDCREIIEANLKAVLGDEEEGLREIWLAQFRRDVVRIYMPGRERFIKVDNNYSLNTYVPPAYLKDWTPPTSPTHPPAEFMELIKVIVQESSIPDMLKWTRDAIFNRAHSIAVLAGSPEIGKNLLVEGNYKALVGESNFHKSTMSFKKEMFNGIWPRKKIGFLDELAVDEDVRDILKNWHNKTATFNRKHVETGSPEVVHTSFIVANNYERKIKLEYNDRKFMVLNLNQVPLKKYWDDAKIDRFNLELCQNPDYLRACAGFLHSNFQKDSSRRFHKDTEAFKKACYYNLPDWFRRLLTACENCEMVTSANIKGISYTTVKDEIEHHERVTGVRIGEVETPTNGKATWTVKSNVFKGQKDEELKV